MAVAREWFGKQVPAAKDAQARTVELLETVSSMSSLPRGYITRTPAKSAQL
jgi:hypothetical protein